ncbi:MAG: hypothetical protein EBS01_05675 [Verrucomicrobia bacterium]|nr:hypothetical protein [Verrucomicrobiota bacterium]
MLNQNRIQNTRTQVSEGFRCVSGQKQGEGDVRFTTLDQEPTPTPHPYGLLPDCLSTSMSCAQDRIYDSQLAEGHVVQTTVICD